MHNGQNRGEAKKRKLSKKRQFHQNRGKFIKFTEMEGKFIHFVEIGGIYNMHH